MIRVVTINHDSEVWYKLYLCLTISEALVLAVATFLSI